MHLICSLSFWGHPDSVSITVENHLNVRIITNISYIIPGSSFLHTADLQNPISPDSQSTIRVPYGYINKLIFETEDGTVYAITGYPASTEPETISISLADKEFGRLFERIYGIYPIAIQNSTDVNFVSVQLHGDSLPDTNLLRSSVLLPEEILRVWLDSGITTQIFAIDAEGFSSALLTINSTPGTDTLYQISPDLFFNNGNEIGYNGSSPGSWVLNCITLGKIVKVEAFSPDGYFLDGVDCSSSPLSTWDRVFLMHNAPIGYIVCTDNNNRTYSADTPESSNGAFIIGNYNLDFSFAFPD
jgi:hypothetical protein